MTVLCDRAFPRSLDALVQRLLAAPPAGVVEAWLFDDAPSRRAAEARLAQAGITARLRSAYKPLLCFVMEELDRAGLRELMIRYPVHPLAPAGRFLAETYPLVPMLPDIAVSLQPGDAELAYQVTATYQDGRVVTRAVRAPNRTRAEVLACCGWLTLPEASEALPTEFEAVFDTALETIRAQNWSGPGPHFERLMLHVELPAEDQDLGWGDEVLSLREAMHEDLFFSLREHLAAAPNGSPTDRQASPGQIVPSIRGPAEPGGPARLRVVIAAFDPPADVPAETVDLRTADRPLAMAQIRAELAAIGGEPFEGMTRTGRTVPGVYKPGTGPAVLVTAGQHANETSGVIGALRAAQALADDPQAHFALVPVENVDGYALHQTLIEANPRHMHHAARYTALGDDVSTHRGPGVARAEALRRSGARLHLNLHGYPAHEWTRPLSGYLPRGFEAWSVPRGFFLIGVHHEGLAGSARNLVERIARDIANDAELVAFNRRQIAALRAHVPEADLEVIHDIPCLVIQADTYEAPITIISEAPDETIYGSNLLLQHTTQMRTVLAAIAAFCRGDEA